MNSPRKITVKMLLNADEYVDFSAACDAVGMKQSPQLRMLVLAWIRLKNSSEFERKERPSDGHLMAISVPARINYSVRMHC